MNDERLKQIITNAATDVADEFYPKGDKRRGEFIRDAAVMNVKILEQFHIDMDKSGLLNIGEKMAEQDNLGTQCPVWVVRDAQKDYVHYSMDWGHKERKIWDGMDDEEYLKLLCDDCRKTCEDWDYSNLPDECEFDLCDTEAFAYYNIEYRPDMTSGAYLTQAACQRHIDENRHHYTKEVHTYAFSAWRNPELQQIMEFLIKCTDREFPNHYLGRG